VRSSAIEPTLDGVSAFRSVGEWMALQGRWNQAAKLYAALIKIDKLNGWGVVAQDYQVCGVVLAESGEADQYESFCQIAVTNLFANGSGGSLLKNGGLLKTCLLFPASKEKLEMLRPMANSEAKNWGGKTDGWACIPPSLWKYRSGDYTAAADWSRLGLAQKNRYPACDATLHCILAMSDYQHGQTAEAGMELAQSRQLIETQLNNRLDRGKSSTGYWFDWIFSSLLLHEATLLIGSDANEVQHR
jgi:hypothetical protein